MSYFNIIKIICCCLVAHSCPILCDPMDYSTPGFPVHHQHLELAQTHVHWVSDPSNHLILCRPLLLLPSNFPSIRVFLMNWLFASDNLPLPQTKASACSAGDLGSIPGLGRSPGEGNGNSFQYPCLENLMDRGAWWAAVRVGHDWLTNTYLLTKLQLVEKTLKKVFDKKDFKSIPGITIIISHFLEILTKALF